MNELVFFFQKESGTNGGKKIKSSDSINQHFGAPTHTRAHARTHRQRIHNYKKLQKGEYIGANGGRRKKNSSKFIINQNTVY